MTQSRCTGCGRKIEWAKTLKGANVPLEKVPIIEIVQTEGSQAIAMPTSEIVLVNHFLTCPKANDFSGRNRT